jgi:hypothetical protein
LAGDEQSALADAAAFRSGVALEGRRDIDTRSAEPGAVLSKMPVSPDISSVKPGRAPPG